MPTVPGLVSEIVVPSKSWTVSLLPRARATISSNASTYCAKSSAPAFLMLGTLSERAPSLPATSTAMPMLIWLCTTRNGSPLILRVGMIERRIGWNGFDDGPADDVRVGDFALADQRAMLVHDAPVLVDHFHRNDALRSSQRNAQAGIHVLGDARGCAAEGNQLLVRAGGAASGNGGRGAPFGIGGCVGVPLPLQRSGPAIRFKNFRPAIVYRFAIVQILLIQLVFEPTVDTKLGRA